MPLRPDRQNRAPTAQDGEGAAEQDQWETKARDAYDASTSYVDTNFRKQWEDGIRAFHSLHPADSKYSSPGYEKRSHLYRPKTRAIIRKNEAAAAAAFFSNMDTVSVGAVDEASVSQVASAEVNKAILDYRLKKTIPWFMVVQGGIQDAQVTGSACAHIWWECEDEDSAAPEEEEAPAPVAADPEHPEQPNLPNGAFTMGGPESAPEQPAVPEPEAKPRKFSVDRPHIDLVPIENIRIDPSASWMDPVNTSPYIIHLMPMYVMDVKAKIEIGEWIDVDEAHLRAAASSKSDSTRQARQKDRDDPQGTDTRAYTDIDIVWVQRHIHRVGKTDMEWYMLDDLCRLSEAIPLKESVLHGRRPYVLGTYILEAHRILSSGVPQVSKGLQDEANEIANQRIDNVKFVLNKKWFAKRGKEVDVGGLVRNVPGSVVMMDDVDHDVREISWPDVTASAFEEQRNINLDMDELLGNFNPAQLIMHGGGNAPARNMAMLNQANATLVEYGIRTFVETFVQPVLRQLVLLEQSYETDDVVIALAMKKAKLFQRFGIDKVTDDLLMQELTVDVTVGMGATDPTAKLQKFLTGLTAFGNIAKSQIPGINLGEVGKEIFKHEGYKDASRFFTNDNPQVALLQAQLQGAMQHIQEMDKKLKEKMTTQVIGLQKVREGNETKKEVAVIQEEAANKRALATHIAALNDAAFHRDHERQLWDKKEATKTKTSSK